MGQQSFSRWFDQQSGYGLHRLPPRRRQVELCCGQPPAPTGLAAREYLPETGEETQLPLCRCASCGKWFLAYQQRFFPVDNPMRWKLVQETPEKEDKP